MFFHIRAFFSRYSPSASIYLAHPCRMEYLDQFSRQWRNLEANKLWIKSELP
jgi:hypothetical protein